MKAKLNQQPFVPFRLQMSDGMQYDIHHASDAMVMSGVFAIGVDRDPATDEPQRLVYIDPHHVTRVEDMAPSNPDGGNGRS